MQKRSLLLITANFPPVSTSGVHRMIRIVRYLHEMDVNITVLTADETTLTKRFKYDEELLQKIPEGVLVVRVPAFQGLKRILAFKEKLSSSNSRKSKTVPTNNSAKGGGKSKQGSSKSILRRLLDNVTLNLHSPDNYAFWIVPAIRTGQKLIREHGIRNILSSSPPGSAHVVAYYLKRQTGVNWIADFRDPWARKEWHNPEMTAFKRRINVLYENRTLQTADKVVMNTQEMLDIYLQTEPALASRARVIPNGYDPADYESLPEPASRNGAPFLLLHTGTLYRGRSPVPFLEAWGKALSDGDISLTDMRVQFIGSVSHFAEDIERLSRRYGLQGSLDLIPSMPHRRCLMEMAHADALLLLQPGTRIQIPAKIYEYIAIRKPIFAISPPGVISRMVETYNLGWWADADDVDQIRRALIRMVRFFRSGREHWPVDPAVLDAFDGRRLVQQIGELLIE